MKKDMIGQKNVDEYIVAFTQDIQLRLKQVRQAIKKAAPAAEEIISYQMPAYRYHGSLVYFASFKNHIGFMPHQQVMLHLKKNFRHIKKGRGRCSSPMINPYH